MTKSLYEIIRSEFEARILSGEMAPGDRLPTEQDLVEYYQCSRMTVNKALRALADGGLIDRRKRAGTFVARPKVHSMVLDIPDLGATIRKRGQEYSYHQIRRRIIKRNFEQFQHAKLSAAAPLLELSGLHFADGSPLAFEKRLIGLRSVPDIADVDLTTTPPGSWLLQHIPWTEAETRISAAGAEVHEARHLLVAVGTPCLKVERQTWRSADPITYVCQLFLADAYDLVARFGPSVVRGNAEVPFD